MRVDWQVIDFATTGMYRMRNRCITDEEKKIIIDDWKKPNWFSYVNEYIEWKK